MAFTRLLAGDLGGGYFAGNPPVIVPRLLPAVGFLFPGCAASLAGATQPTWLNLRQPRVRDLRLRWLHSRERKRGQIS